MDDLNNSVNWEEFFIQEAVELEEKMKSLDVDSLNKSKLRLCLENNILEWPVYERWCMSRLGCSSLKMSVTDEDLEKFIDSAKMSQETYSNYDFWSEDLIPLMTWDNQIIILGIQYNEKLVAIENHIFILAPPHLLSSISLKLFDSNMIKNENSDEISEDSKSLTESNLDGINFDISAPQFKFDPNEMVSVISPSQAVEKKGAIWELISERHHEYNFEAKKQFDAFIILKIVQNKINVFKMDQELSKKGVSNMIFECNLDSSKPFKKVFDTGRTELFLLEELNMKLAPFKHLCITPLKIGKSTVGFFIGFKTENPSAQDKLLLEELANELAS
jgi:hypothetical protein